MQRDSLYQIKEFDNLLEDVQAMLTIFLKLSKIEKIKNKITSFTSNVLKFYYPK